MHPKKKRYPEIFWLEVALSAPMSRLRPRSTLLAVNIRYVRVTPVLWPYELERALGRFSVYLPEEAVDLRDFHVLLVEPPPQHY